MRAAQGVLRVCALFPLLALAGEEKPSHPPISRELIESIGQRRNWKPMAIKEDGVLIVGGTCDAKKVEETFGICRKALDKFCATLKVTPEELAKKDKLWFVVVADKKDFLTLADSQKTAELYNRVAAAGNFLCIDRVYGTTPEGDVHLTAHLFTHRILESYETLHPAAPTPGWMVEGLGAWMDGFISGSPASCCIAKVGYDEESYKDRSAGASWEQSIARAVKKYLALKEKDRLTADYTPMRNLVGKPFDRLSGTDVAASWSLVSALVGDKQKPEGFKAFYDGILDGGKQPAVFQSAFGRSFDDFEKGWMKGVAAKAEPPPDPKNGKKK